MATFKRFEDIEAWQKARELTKRVYAASRSGDLRRDFSLRDQVRRSAVSVMSNIAEGFERGGGKEFVQFLSVARGSAGELRSQLQVAVDVGYLSDADGEELSGLAREVSRMIAGLMAYLRRSDLEGPKFRRPDGGAEMGAPQADELET